jgi:hypothetical protein
VVDAKKVKIDRDAAWEMLSSAKAVSVAKGKKFQRFESVKEQKDAILQQAIGPSGNLRAPTYRAEDQFVIGFNAELYDDWVT